MNQWFINYEITLLSSYSGGISIKLSAGMEDMRADMGGAACVLGAIYTVAKLGIPINVIGQYRFISLSSVNHLPVTRQSPLNQLSVSHQLLVQHLAYWPLSHVYIVVLV